MLPGYTVKPSCTVQEKEKERVRAPLSATIASTFSHCAKHASLFFFFSHLERRSDGLHGTTTARRRSLNVFLPRYGMLEPRRRSRPRLRRSARGPATLRSRAPLSASARAARRLRSGRQGKETVMCRSQKLRNSANCSGSYNGHLSHCEARNLLPGE